MREAGFVIGLMYVAAAFLWPQPEVDFAAIKAALADTCIGGTCTNLDALVPSLIISPPTILVVLGCVVLAVSLYRRSEVDG